MNNDGENRENINSQYLKIRQVQWKMLTTVNMLTQYFRACESKPLKCLEKRCFFIILIFEK